MLAIMKTEDEASAERLPAANSQWMLLRGDCAATADMNGSVTIA